MKLPPLLLVSVLFLGCGAGCTTTMPVAAETADYAGFDYVTVLEGVKKDDIYDGVKMWIAENFRSAKQVIDLENKEQGVVIGNGVLPNIMLSSGLVTIQQSASFKMKVEVKDDKMRLTFSQYQITSRNNTTLFKSEVDQIKSQLAKFGDEIAKYLKNPKSKNF